MKLVVVLGSSIGDERSAFDTVIPQYHRRVRLAHVLPRSFLEETNAKFRTVRMLGTCLQSPQGGADLAEIGSHFLLDLGRVGITHQLVRSSYFLRESLQSMNVVALRSHTKDIRKPTVRYKHLAAFVSARQLRLLCHSSRSKWRTRGKLVRVRL